ncbi:MAG: hypothetical protein ABJA69_01760 [Acidobacteriaceae bacterium]
MSSLREVTTPVEMTGYFEIAPLPTISNKAKMEHQHSYQRHVRRKIPVVGRPFFR